MNNIINKQSCVFQVSFLACWQLCNNSTNAMIIAFTCLISIECIERLLQNTTTVYTIRPIQTKYMHYTMCYATICYTQARRQGGFQGFWKPPWRAVLNY